MDKNMIRKNNDKHLNLKIPSLKERATLTLFSTQTCLKLVICQVSFRTPPSPVGEGRTSAPIVHEGPKAFVLWRLMFGYSIISPEPLTKVPSLCTCAENYSMG